MKTCIATGLILLLLTVLAAADTAPTVRFDQTLVRFDSESMMVRYADFQTLAVGHRLVLPSVTRYIRLDDPSRVPMISTLVPSGPVIGSVSVDDLRDIPTSDATLTYLDYDRLISDRPGTQPVEVIDRITIGETTYLRLSVTPVSVDTDGRLTFNGEIFVYLDGALLESSRLLTAEQLPVTTDKKRYSSTTAGSADVIKYLIVTSPALIDACQLLADYKNSTGINTEVVSINDILAGQTGRDDAEKLRNYLKDFYTDRGIYLLLAGDETQLPIRYAYPNSAYSMPPLAEQQICDLYFGDLTGEWDVDNDGVWGEKYIDQADLTPELYVGRLPFSTADEMGRYVDKLIRYETDPGAGDAGYVENVFFFSSDQMRDYGTIGQHGLVAEAFGNNFAIDTANGVEYSSGEDPNPTNIAADEVEPILDQGYGVVNIISHGSYSTFGVRTSGYNDWPKSYFTTDNSLSEHGLIDRLTPNHNSALYYSVGCDNGAFDMDQPPFNQTNRNLVEALLALESAGAVAFVANSRWGWVGASHYLHKAFFDSLWAHPDRPAVAAMYASKAAYYYYRDLAYGQNFYGDPTLRIYSQTPDWLDLTVTPQANQTVVTVSFDELPVEECKVVLSRDGLPVGEFLTGADGTVDIDLELDLGIEYTVAATKPGHTISRESFTPSLSTNVDSGDSELPNRFDLAQNYPNPFNPTTTIAFELPQPSAVKLAIYNVLGQMVRVLKDGVLETGTYLVEWDGTDSRGNSVASGIYFYRMQTPDFTSVRKMVLLR